MNTRKILATIAIAAAGIGIGGTAAAAKPVPLSYTCAVAKVGQLPAACATLPGVWNDWAGRPTSVRWDPCVGDATLFHVTPCGRMSPTIRQWCTLHVDHHYLGVDLCHNRGQK